MLCSDKILDFDNDLAVEVVERGEIASEGGGVSMENGTARGKCKIDEVASIIT